jgi:hypothetical protein
VVNKSVHQSKPRLQSLVHVTLIGPSVTDFKLCRKLLRWRLLVLWKMTSDSRYVHLYYKDVWLRNKNLWRDLCIHGGTIHSTILLDVTPSNPLHVYRLSSETSVTDYQTTRRPILENNILQNLFAWKTFSLFKFNTAEGSVLNLKLFFERKQKANNSAFIGPSCSVTRLIRDGISHTRLYTPSSSFTNSGFE